MTENYPEIEAYVERTLQIGIVEANLSTQAVIDWMAVKDGGSRISDWARCRGVKPRAVRENVEEAFGERRSD
jgi:hypothetical protein